MNKITEDSVRGKGYYGDWFVDEFIEAFKLDFRLGNAVKYMMRAGKKTNNSISDLTKAKTYIKRYIQRVTDKPQWMISNEQGKMQQWIDEAVTRFKLSENIIVSLNIICGFEMGVTLEHSLFRIDKEIFNESN